MEKNYAKIVVKFAEKCAKNCEQNLTILRWLAPIWEVRKYKNEFDVNLVLNIEVDNV